MKSKITTKKQNINRKGIAQYQVMDFTDYIFSSNNRNPLPVKQGNRRLAVFDTNPEMRGNKTYFKSLANHLSKPIVKWAFYQFLRNLPTYDSPMEFQNSIPVTRAYVEVRILNAPLYLKWIVSEVKQGVLENDTVRELYNRFKAWIKCNKEGNEDNLITETAFGLILNKSKDAGQQDEPPESGACYVLPNAGDKSKVHGIMQYKWNIPQVIDGLKKLHLLESNFTYKE